MPATVKGIGLHLEAKVAEVLAHALPGPARRDRDLLVVVAHAAPGGERVAQPEPVLRGHAVGGVAEVGRPLVRGHHEVGVVVVVAHDLRRVDDLAVHDVVGDVEQAGDELAVAVDQVVVEGGPGGHVALQHEAALGAHGHDDRVLDHLGLHEAQDLGAEVVVAVAPADAAARDLAPAQVDPLELARVHVDLDHRPRRGHALHLPAVHLDGEHGPGRALVVVRAQRAADEVVEAAQDLVVDEAHHGLHRLLDPRFRLREGGGALHGQARVEPRLEGAEQGDGHGMVALQHAVDRLRVVVRTDLQEMVADGAQHLDLLPGEAAEEDQAVQGIVRRPLLVEGAQGLGEPLLALDEGSDALRARVHVEAVEEAAPSFREHEGDAQLLGDGEPEVLERAQRLREAEGPHRIELQGGRLGRAREDPHFEPALEPLEIVDVLHDLRGLRGLAVEAGEALFVPAEELPSRALAHRLHEGGGHAVLPGGEPALHDPPHRVRLQRLLEARAVEVVDEQADRSEVGGGRERDRPELAGQGLAEVLLRLVRVAHAGEGDGQGRVPLATPRVHRDLVVPRHVDDAVDDVLEARGGGVEQLALREAVEEGADLAIDVAVGQVAAVHEQPVVLLPEERDVRRLLGERDLGQPPEEHRGFEQLARLAPLAHDHVVEGVDVVQRGGVVREVDVHDARVLRGRREARLNLFHEVREHDGQQALVRERAQRALRDAMGGPVGGEPIAHAAEEDEVLVEHPGEERARGLHPPQAFGAVAQPLAEVARRPLHLLVVLDGGEDGLEDREHLVLDPAQALLRLHALDLEVAVQLLGPVVLRPRHPHRPLPLPAHGEDLVDGREDAQPGLPEVVLEALEDEGRVQGVGLDDRRLEGDAVAGAPGRRFLFRGIAGGDVDAGQPLVQLDRVRDLAGDEAERAEHARGQRVGGKAERDAIGHAAEDDGREGQEQVPVLRRGPPGKDPLQLVQAGGAPPGIGRDHRVSRQPRSYPTASASRRRRDHVALSR